LLFSLHNTRKNEDHYKEQNKRREANERTSERTCEAFEMASFIGFIVLRIWAFSLGSEKREREETQGAEKTSNTKSD
jgi:hypothetical protein